MQSENRDRRHAKRLVRLGPVKPIRYEPYNAIGASAVAMCAGTANLSDLAALCLDRRRPAP
jgi:hypothetical protein